MMSDKINMDGKWHPEPWFNRWRGVRYSVGKDDVLQIPTGKRVRGRFLPEYFDTEDEAQAKCDALNKKLAAERF